MKRFMVMMLVAAITLSGGTVSAVANNCKNTEVTKFSYYGDGSDYVCEKIARKKTDTTASYVKLNTDTTCKQTVTIYGAKTKSSAYFLCTSGTTTIKPGDYKYISNTVYQQGYTYAAPAFGRDNRKNMTVSGVWSPDNISGRY